MRRFFHGSIRICSRRVCCPFGQIRFILIVKELIVMVIKSCRKIRILHKRLHSRPRKESAIWRFYAPGQIPDKFITFHVELMQLTIKDIKGWI
ncbi:hypothetical protein HanXRQr2_Chr13g0592671 [Helianthus annuus]|uniref:Uncharacterized protein n=1 Tax=Helianthus annuus TaxID=4232 RepID=A0A9K3EKW7_HELAN|nr:hypothetical protein HanXRQr2_Chr13g0592671 [Helianthus annuus]